MEKSFHGYLKKTAQVILYFLLVLLVVSMFLGSGHLLSLFVEMVASPNPYMGLLNVQDLGLIFSMMLNIVVGYELFKSISIIIKSDMIPVGPILKIGGIAVANKIITIDLKNYDFNTILLLSLLIAGLGAAYFLFSKGEG